MSFPLPERSSTDHTAKRGLPVLPTTQFSIRASLSCDGLQSSASEQGGMSSSGPVKKALPTIVSPRSPLSSQDEEIAKLRKELEEEKKKNAHLEVNLASQTKIIKSLEVQLAKEKSELEFLKSKIATAIVRKESNSIGSSSGPTGLPASYDTSDKPKPTSVTVTKIPSQVEVKRISTVSNVESTPPVKPELRQPLQPNKTLVRPSIAATTAQQQKKNTYRDPRLTQGITKINNIMTKIILDVIGGDFDVASARTFDSIIDEITEICEPEFTKMKNPEEKKAMFQMLDDFEDISVQFTNVAMKLRKDPDNEELLTKLDHKTKRLEELLDELGGVLFEKPELQLERMSRLSRVQPATYRQQPQQPQPQPQLQSNHTIQPPPQLQKADSDSSNVGKGRSRIINRTTNTQVQNPFSLSTSPQSQSPSSPNSSGSYLLPSLPILPTLPVQPQITQSVSSQQPVVSVRLRATEFSCPTFTPNEDDKSEDSLDLLQRQSKKLARVSMKMVASERQVVSPEVKAEERRVSRVIRRSMTANTSLEEKQGRRSSKSQASAAAAEVALHMSSSNPVTGKWQPRMGPNAVRTTNDKVVIPVNVLENNSSESEGEPKRVHRKSSIFGLIAQQPSSPSRHALVKPTLPVKTGPTEIQYSSSSEEDDMSDMDEDDEDLIAQREEFAALFGKSLKDLVKEKEDKKVWKQLELVGSLITKCTISTTEGTHVSKFLCSTILKETGNLTTLLRTLGDGNMTYYELADDVEDHAEEFMELSKKLYKLHCAKAKNIDTSSLLNSEVVFQKLLKNIAEFKQNDIQTAVKRGKI